MNPTQTLCSTTKLSNCSPIARFDLVPDCCEAPNAFYCATARDKQERRWERSNNGAKGARKAGRHRSMRPSFIDARSTRLCSKTTASERWPLLLRPGMRETRREVPCTLQYVRGVGNIRHPRTSSKISIDTEASHYEEANKIGCAPQGSHRSLLSRSGGESHHYSSDKKLSINEQSLSDGASPYAKIDEETRRTGCAL